MEDSRVGFRHTGLHFRAAVDDSSGATVGRKSLCDPVLRLELGFAFPMVKLPRTAQGLPLTESKGVDLPGSGRYSGLLSPP